MDKDEQNPGKSDNVNMGLETVQSVPPMDMTETLQSGLSDKEEGIVTAEVPAIPMTEMIALSNKGDVQMKTWQE